MRRSRSITLFLILTVLLAACGGGGGNNNPTPEGGSGEGGNGDGGQGVVIGGEPEDEFAETVPEGFQARAYFPPDIPFQRVQDMNETVGQAIFEASGIFFYPVEIETDAEMVIEMCNDPEIGMAFMNAPAFLLGQQLCGLQPAGVVGRNGNRFHHVALVTRTITPVTNVFQLTNLRWAAPLAPTSVEYLYALQMLREAGATPGELISTASTRDALRLLYDGEVEWAAVYFNGHQGPQTWVEGMPPEPYADERGAVTFDPLTGRTTWRDNLLLDARTLLMPEATDVYSRTRIITLSPVVPNEVLVFGARFNAAAASTLRLAFSLYMQTPDCADTICTDPAFAWTSIEDYAEIDYVGLQGRMEAASVNVQTQFDPELVDEGFESDP